MSGMAVASEKRQQEEQIPALDTRQGMLYVVWRGYTDKRVVGFSHHQPVSAQGKRLYGVNPQMFYLQSGYVYDAAGAYIPWPDVPPKVRSDFQSGAKTLPQPGVHLPAARLYKCPAPGDNGEPGTGCPFVTQSRDNYSRHCLHIHGWTPERLAQFEAAMRGEKVPVGSGRREIVWEDFADAEAARRLLEDGDMAASLDME